MSGRLGFLQGSLRLRANASPLLRREVSRLSTVPLHNGARFNWFNEHAPLLSPPCLGRVPFEHRCSSRIPGGAGARLLPVAGRAFGNDKETIRFTNYRQVIYTLDGEHNFKVMRDSEENSDSVGKYLLNC